MDIDRAASPRAGRGAEHSGTLTGYRARVRRVGRYASTLTRPARAAHNLRPTGKTKIAHVHQHVASISSARCSHRDRSAVAHSQRRRGDTNLPRVPRAGGRAE